MKTWPRKDGDSFLPLEDALKETLGDRYAEVVISHQGATIALRLGNVWHGVDIIGAHERAMAAKSCASSGLPVGWTFADDIYNQALKSGRVLAAGIPQVQQT